MFGFRCLHGAVLGTIRVAGGCTCGVRGLPDFSVAKYLLQLDNGTRFFEMTGWGANEKKPGHAMAGGPGKYPLTPTLSHRGEKGKCGRN